jgi:hypothetical protein
MDARLKMTMYYKGPALFVKFRMTYFESKLFVTFNNYDIGPLFKVV